MRHLALILTLCFMPSLASGVGFLTFDTAQTLEPQQVELSAGFAAGDAHWAGQLSGRVGLISDLDIHLRVGTLVVDDHIGPEAHFGARWRLLPLSKTGQTVEVAISTHSSFAYNSQALGFGFDPKVLASRHFSINKKQQWFVGLGVGAALTVYNVSGPGDDLKLGILATANAGADVSPGFRVTLEGALRDDIKRIGAGLAFTF